MYWKEMKYVVIICYWREPSPRTVQERMIAQHHFPAYIYSNRKLLTLILFPNPFSLLVQGIGSEQPFSQQLQQEVRKQLKQFSLHTGSAYPINFLCTLNNLGKTGYNSSRQQQEERKQLSYFSLHTGNAKPIDYHFTLIHLGKQNTNTSSKWSIQ